MKTFSLYTIVLLLFTTALTIACNDNAGYAGKDLDSYCYQNAENVWSTLDRLFRQNNY